MQIRKTNTDSIVQDSSLKKERSFEAIFILDFHHVFHSYSKTLDLFFTNNQIIYFSFVRRQMYNGSREVLQSLISYWWVK